MLAAEYLRYQPVMRSELFKILSYVKTKVIQFKQRSNFGNLYQ